MIPFLPGKATLIGMVGAALLSAFSAWWVTKEIYQSEIAEIHLAHQVAVTAAVEQARKNQKAVDDIALAKAVAEAEAQEIIVTRTHTITEEVPYYVKDTSTCITVGLVRVLDAAALGADPAGLALAPGEFNESCAAITASALARNIVTNYGIAHQNAQQLSGLQDWVRETAEVLNAERTPP